MIRRIVLALQFWDGDKEAAMRNARRIADNEPKHRDDVEMCFVARFDCKHDEETIKYVQKKFRVSRYTCYRRATGWPAGPNDVWFDLMQESIRRVKSGEWAEVKCLFTFEADCIPVHPDWLDRLHREWSLAENEGKWLTGWWGDSCTQWGHCNGNALFHPLISMFVPQAIGCKGDTGWDVAMAPYFQGHWRKSKFLENLYRYTSVPAQQLADIVKSGAVCIHGVKDYSCEGYADQVLRKHPTL